MLGVLILNRLVKWCVPVWALYNAKGHQGIRVKVSRSQLVHRSGRALLSRIIVHDSILPYGRGPHCLPALAVLRDRSTQWIPVDDGNTIGNERGDTPLERGNEGTLHFVICAA